MATSFTSPHPRVIRQHLKRLKLVDLRLLSQISGVPYTTLFNIRSGDTPNPRSGTVHAISLAYGRVVNVKAAS